MDGRADRHAAGDEIAARQCRGGRVDDDFRHAIGVAEADFSRDFAFNLFKCEGCERAEIGQVADALETAVRAALGQDTRIDVLFPRGADFSREKTAYAALLERGGRLVAARNARPQAPSAEPAPDLVEEGAAAEAPTGASGDAAQTPR